ncbi:MAG: copper amine oxidase N-terminal domain-containing protein [Firmicutes bacterium]|nr:copper amine oxidase N-terminal domain-containing protein [Bacillota bacterium]
MKKLVSLLLALVLVFAMSSVAMAAEPVEVSTFADLEAALEAGNDVVLVDDIEITGNDDVVVVTTKDVVLDLNGHTLVANSQKKCLFYIDGNSLTVKDTVGDGGITFTGAKTNQHMFSVWPADTYPDATLNIYGGTFTCNNAVISGNGTADNTEINIYGGELNGGKTAIYHPQEGVLNISGGTIKAATAVYFKSGSLNITGGTLIGTGAKQDYQYEGSGFEPTGEALVIENVGTGGYQAVGNVNISGGTFKSENASAVGSYAAKDSPSDAPTGATEEAETGFITGGAFTSAEDAQMEENLISDEIEVKVDADGKIYVGDSIPVKSAKRYEVGVAKTENGDVTVKGSASYDSGVVITAAPHYGYEVGTVTVTKADGTKLDVTERADGTYSFSMPRGEVAIKVTFVPQGEAVKMVLTIGSKAVDVNGKAVASDVAPVIKNSRTFLPVRLIAENLGAKVEWNNDAQTVTITKGETVIVLTVGSTTVLVNGQPAELEAPVFIENSRTYLPVRFIAEKLGADVEWNGATNEVTIIGRK